MVHGFDWPDRFVVGTVGEPGDRTFYLQVRDGRDVVSVALEKQQTAQLALGIDRILDELRTQDGNPFHVPEGTADELRDDEPLDAPVLERFRVGRMALGWDPSTAQIVIEALPLVVEDEDDDEDALDVAEPDERLVVRIPVGSARAFALRTREVVSAGRPICTLCGEPMDADGSHACGVPDDLT
ncbi:conserved hypothetical protein [Agrococcus jejuensis]|uniref:DUF3090 domain-containing protein n=1 Tax=Agrococcus jejuensis TaxID=399736 RepID=A0A1G8AVG1_9MICO|nr:conserved hypothetical protein [Agrococcus jejuensis]